MTSNPFKRKVVFEVWYGDLDDFVSKCYDREWSSLDAEAHAHDGFSNDTYHTYEVAASPGGPDYYLGNSSFELEEWKSGGPKPPSIEVILWDLCCSGHIEPGEYLLNVSW